jgi:hypothetical protein
LEQQLLVRNMVQQLALELERLLDSKDGQHMGVQHMEKQQLGGFQQQRLLRIQL